VRETAGEARRASLTRPNAAAIWVGQGAGLTIFGFGRHEPRSSTVRTATARVSEARRI